MNINSDKQYQDLRKEYLSLKGRGSLSGTDQQRFNELQTACSQWESSPTFKGDRVTGIDSHRSTTKTGTIGDPSIRS